MPPLIPTFSANGTLPWGGLLTGVTGFDERAFASGLDPLDLQGTGWGDIDARRRRYALYWALYEGNVYRRIHHWVAGLKEHFDLYPATRSLYCPTYRQIEFWAGHLWGGTLDPEAGDGDRRTSALPIVIPDSNPKAEDLRRAIARLWAVDTSNWQANKDTVTRLGSVLGDVALTVVDDPARQIVRLHVVHPRTIRRLEKDDSGNVQGYELEEIRLDPEADRMVPISSRLVGYLERATRVGDAIHYQTYRDDGGGYHPYDWRTYPDERSPRVGADWTESYGFIPFFHIQHRDMGLGWGWAEPHPSLSKLLELHDAASLVGDQFRKAVNARWFFAGMAPPGGGSAGRAGDLDLRRGEDEDDEDWRYDREDVRSARNDEDAIYCADAKGRAQPLVAPLNLSAALNHIRSLLAELERDHPELQADMATSAGDASGRALRVARERVEAMVVQRRSGYDNGLVRAQKAAISIGTQKGYPGYETFDEGSFVRGELEHTIGDRPVFAVDELDRLEEKQSRANLLAVLVRAGTPLDVAFEIAEYPEEVVAKVQAGMRAQADQIDRLRGDQGGAAGLAGIGQ